MVLGSGAELPIIVIGHGLSYCICFRLILRGFGCQGGSEYIPPRNIIRMAVRVAIIGGDGGMGRIFARLFKAEGCEVTICGPTELKGKAAASELGVKYVKTRSPGSLRADAAIITVPNSGDSRYDQAGRPSCPSRGPSHGTSLP